MNKSLILLCLLFLMLISFIPRRLIKKENFIQQQDVHQHLDIIDEEIDEENNDVTLQKCYNDLNLGPTNNYDNYTLDSIKSAIISEISPNANDNLASLNNDELASECSSYINKATIEKNSLRNCYVNNLELGTTTEYNDEYDSNGINNIKTNIINEMIHSASNTQSNLELMDNTSLATQCSSYAEYTQSNLDECILNQGIFHEGTDSITSKRDTIIDKIQERGELLTNAASITNEELLEKCASLYVDYDDDERDEYYGKWHKAWQ